MGGQPHAPAALPWERSGTHCVGGGWDSESVWTGVENLATTGIRSPDRPAYTESLYCLRYPDVHCASVSIYPNGKGESLYILAYTTFVSRLWRDIAEDLCALKTILLDMPKSTVRGLSEHSYLFSWPRKLNAFTNNEVSLPCSQKPSTPHYSEQVHSNTQLTNK